MFLVELWLVGVAADEGIRVGVVLHQAKNCLICLTINSLLEPTYL